VDTHEAQRNLYLVVVFGPQYSVCGRAEKLGLPEEVKSCWPAVSTLEIKT